MTAFDVHWRVPKDLQALPPADPTTLKSDTLMDEFLEEIERLSTRQDYRRVWPERIADIGETSYGGAEYAHVQGIFTLYTWSLDKFVLCLEERLSFGNVRRFRWLICGHGISADAAIREALARARDPW
ncbi:MAG TPA: hypothetical protein VGG63_08345 [Steroidobacteraceae bacterium]|jgi:hypothetical protein